MLELEPDDDSKPWRKIKERVAQANVAQILTQLEGIKLWDFKIKTVPQKTIMLLGND